MAGAEKLVDSGGAGRLYEPEVPPPAWKNNPSDVRSVASRYAKATHFDNPLIHGLISAGLGYAGGYLLNPIIKRLYPEVDGGRFPKMTALMGGLLGGGLSYMNMPPSAAKQAAYSAPIHPLLMHKALRPMMQQGAVPPAAGYAMGAVMQSAGRGGPTNVQSYASTASKALQAVGTYLDPRARTGWAVAGAGAALASRALGMDKSLEKRFGTSVGRAVQSAGPGLQLLAAGLNMAGGR